MEIWKPVPSVPGLNASSYGRLMLDTYTAPMPNGGTRTYGGVPTRGAWDGTRYIWCCRGRTRKVARLVCEAFNGKPKRGQVCMHKDENARNNKPDNLAWGTQKENLNAPGFIKYCHGRIGADSPVIKGRAK